MSSKVTGIVVGAGFLVLIVGASLFFNNKVHFVDSAPALAAANEYFSYLEKGEPLKAFELYSSEFRARQGEQWKEFLVNVQVPLGTVVSYTLFQAHVVPVERLGCYELRYRVERAHVNSDEGFVVCPADPQPTWVIVGHSLVRTDTGQHVSAGITPVEVGVQVP
jgi:hypothetical protein